MLKTISSCNNTKIASILISVYEVTINCWSRIKPIISVREHTEIILLKT